MRTKEINTVVEKIDGMRKKENRQNEEEIIQEKQTES